MKRCIGLALMVLLILAGAGCSQRLIDFTLISTKNVDLSKLGLARATAREEGEDLRHIIIFIPTGVPSMKECVDRAIEKVPGAVALADGVVNYRWWYIPYIYGQMWYVVQGTPLVDASLAQDTSDDTGDFMVAVVGTDGMVADFKSVTRAEYDAIRSGQGPDMP